MSLDKFKKPIEVAKKVVNKKYTAYKMDSTDKASDMRKTVGLGTCQCCDYFLSENQFIILIEETKLPKEIDKEIKTEMQLKAYGSMLVLCRLSMECASAKELVRNKKYKFWVVDSNTDKLSDERYTDVQSNPLKQALTRVIGRKLLCNVEVLSAEAFKVWLSNNAATP